VVSIGLPLSIPTLGDLSYLQRLINVLNPDIIWPVTDALGSDVLANAVNPGTYDAIPSNITLQDSAFLTGETVGLWNGTTSYANIYPALTALAFDPGDKFSIALFLRKSTWDATQRWFFRIAEDANNEVYIAQLNATQQLFRYRAGGLNKNVTLTASPVNTWWSAGLTVDTTVGTGEMLAYYNGVQEGATQTNLGTWVGALASTTCTLGARSTAPINCHSGLLAYCCIAKGVAWTPAQMALFVPGSG
jgi:hypothetical protein